MTCKWIRVNHLVSYHLCYRLSSWVIIYMTDCLNLKLICSHVWRIRIITQRLYYSCSWLIVGTFQQVHLIFYFVLMRWILFWNTWDLWKPIRREPYNGAYIKYNRSINLFIASEEHVKFSQLLQLQEVHLDLAKRQIICLGQWKRWLDSPTK